MNINSNIVHDQQSPFDLALPHPNAKLKLLSCYLTHFRFPANLTLARVRRQKNHSGKLQSADGQLEHDGGIKERENAREQSVVSLQQANCYPQDRDYIKEITIRTDFLNYRGP